MKYLSKCFIHLLIVDQVENIDNKTSGEEEIEEETENLTEEELKYRRREKLKLKHRM